MVEIDGSFGEGGGQILRTSLSLSCLTGKPFRIFNIRKNRRKPGLQPQHLTSVRAAKLISGAQAKGDEIGSSELAFEPSGCRPGEYAIDIGTAGSTSLVLQTVVPALLFAGGESEITLTGGTHVPMSPPFDYLAEVYGPALERLGLDARFRIEKYGFYPKGGGKVQAHVRPAEGVRPLVASGRGGLVRLSGVSAVGNLPDSIARRQKDALTETLRAASNVEADVRVESVPTPGTGTFMFLLAEYEGAVAGFSSIGIRGKRAEVVGAEAAQQFLRYHESGAALDMHLADQLAVFLPMADGVSSFTTESVSQHLLTNLETVKKFHDFDYRIDGSEGGPGRATINELKAVLRRSDRP